MFCIFLFLFLLPFYFFLRSDVIMPDRVKLFPDLSVLQFSLGKTVE